MAFDPFNKEKSGVIRDYALAVFLVVVAFSFLVGVFYTMHAVSPVLERFEPSVTSEPANDLGSKEEHLIHVKTYLVVKYRDGNLLYRGYIKPIDGRSFKYLSCIFTKDTNSFDSPTPHIILTLRDSDGFAVTRISLTKDSLQTTVDDENQPVLYTFEGSTPIYLSDYKDIDSYDLSWRINEKCEGVR